MKPSRPALAARLLPWYHRHGRHDLPWQRDADPYRIWVSEVMLQQTQVATVIPYYERFLRRFPEVAALARARQDEVLALWAGLGYYARGRNLHRAAREIVAKHGGCLPRTFQELVALPGVGRSTAGAILALAHGERHPILDGNVRRVLARVFLVRGPPGQAMAALWELAERCTPRSQVAAYTQAIMDLGATVCTRTRPDCRRCPLRAACGALAAGIVDELPARRPRGPRPLRRTHMVFVLQGGRVLLRRRPPRGVWGGLWVPPEFAGSGAVQRWCADIGERDAQPRRLSALRHAFTHFDLDIVPWVLELPTGHRFKDAERGRWIAPGAAAGLPAPVARLLLRARPTVGAREEHGNGENGAMRSARPRSGGTGSRSVSGGTRPAHP